MDKLLQALIDSGFRVRFGSGAFEDGPSVKKVSDAGCTVIITTEQWEMMGQPSRWEGYGATAREGLQAASFQLQQHMRPTYEGYLTMAEAFGWEL